MGSVFPQGQASRTWASNLHPVENYIEPPIFNGEIAILREGAAQMANEVRVTSFQPGLVVPMTAGVVSLDRYELPRKALGSRLRE
ncbi:MAG: hypothetical protein ACI8X5_000545 [Planctomycetota bacterium]